MHYKTCPSSKESWLVHTIRTIVTSTDKIIYLHKYKFENTRDAAIYKTGILKQSKYDFTRALAKEDGKMLEPGSEIRTKATIGLLFQDHEHWENMSDIIKVGVSYPLEDLFE